MKKAILAIAVIVFIFACSGGGGSNSNPNNRPPVNSALDLRLGQISSSSSPVAVSAALQNGESVTIYADGSTDEFEAIYIAPSGNALQVKHDTAGKPFFAQFSSTTVAYTNYTKENTLDITVQSTDTNRRARSSTINHHLIEADVLEFLNSELLLQIILETHQDPDSEIRARLAATYAALRVVGCSSSEFAPDEFSTELCSSELLEKIRIILKESNYGGITVNLSNQYPNCEAPETFEQKSTCAIEIWKDLLEATKQGIVGDYPDNGNSNSGGNNSGSGNNGDNSSTGENKPTPTYTPTPTSTPTVTFTPTPTNTPIGGVGGNTNYLGSWSSSTIGNFGSCSFSSLHIDFVVTAEDVNHTCQGNYCLNGVSIINGNPSNFSGIVDRITGNITPFAAEIVIQGDLNTDDTGIADFKFNPPLADCGILGINFTRIMPPPS